MELGKSLVSSDRPVLWNNLRIYYQLLLLSEQIYSKSPEEWERVRRIYNLRRISPKSGCIAHTDTQSPENPVHLTVKCGWVPHSVKDYYFPEMITVCLDNSSKNNLKLKIMSKSQQIRALGVGWKEGSIPKVSTGEWLRNWWGSESILVWSGRSGRIEYFGGRNMCLTFI